MSFDRRVAQLVRALARHARGRRFESVRAYHLGMLLNGFVIDDVRSQFFQADWHRQCACFILDI